MDAAAAAGPLAETRSGPCLQSTGRGLAAVKKEAILLRRETGILVLFGEEGSREGGLPGGGEEEEEEEEEEGGANA